MTPSQVADEFRTARFVEHEHGRVCWRKAGDGPAVVLLHGFPLSGLTWRRVVASLADRFTCWAPDLVGLGETTSTRPEDFSSPGQARLLQQALAALGVTSYALVGNDTGGWIARELALLETRRVTHLALTNTEIPGHRPPWIPFYQRVVGLPGIALVFRRILASRAMRRSPMGFGGCFDDLASIDGEFFELFVAPILRSPARIASLITFLRQMRFTRLDRFRELHAQLVMPVGFIWGAADPTFPEPLARAMASQFPNVVGFWSIPRGKLFVQEEQPETVARLLGELLAPARAR